MQRLDFIDRSMNVLYWVVIALLWLYTATNYFSLPGEIPIHFDWSGQPDNTGARYILWLLPAMATVIGVVFMVLERSPHIFNYPFEITKNNAERQYLLAVRLLKVLRISIALLFSFVVYTIIEFVKTGESFNSIEFLLILLVLIIVPLGVYFYVAHRARKLGTD